MPVILNKDEQKEAAKIVNQVSESFKRQPVYPEGVNAMNQFPGLDPLGKFTKMDLQFAEREEKVKAGTQFMTDIVKQQVKNLEQAADSLKSGMKAAAAERRIMERCDRSAHSNLNLKAFFNDKIEQIDGKECISDYDKTLTAMEYMTGIRKGNIPEELHTFCRETLKCPINELAEMQKGQIRANLDNIAVHYENPEHLKQQRKLASMEFWGKMDVGIEADIDIPLDEGDKEYINFLQYNMITLNRTLDPIYKDFEASNGGKPAREDLIMIDGKTIKDISKDFDRIPNENRKNEVFYHSLSSALMTGKKVELFRPDPVSGGIDKAPIQVSAEGFEPDPKRPTMNLWERFWSHFGFYQEKKQSIIEFDLRQKQINIDKEKMVGKIETINNGLQYEKNKADFQSFGEQINQLPDALEEEYFPQGSELNVDGVKFPWEAAHTDLAMAILLNKGLSEEEAAIPGTHLKEKREAGFEARVMIGRRDHEEVGKLMASVMDKYSNDVINMDHTDINQYSDNLGGTYVRGHMLQGLAGLASKEALGEEGFKAFSTAVINNQKTSVRDLKKRADGIVALYQEPEKFNDAIQALDADGKNPKRENWNNVAVEKYIFGQMGQKANSLTMMGPEEKNVRYAESMIDGRFSGAIRTSDVIEGIKGLKNMKEEKGHEM